MGVGDRGAGRPSLKNALLAEVTSRSGHLATAALGFTTPATGNMELLVQFDDESQHQL